MEQTSFNSAVLQIDEQAGNYLSQTATWAKFLAIVGFLVCGLLVIAGIFIKTLLDNYRLSDDYMQYGINNSDATTVIIIVYIGMAVLFFFPYLYLYRFAARMQKALRDNNQTILNNSFKNIKACFHYVGIVTIVILSIYALGIILFILRSSMY